MNRKTRREQKRDTVTQLFVNDLTNYLTSSERLAATLTEDEISEIVSFLTFFENIGEALDSNDEYTRVLFYIVSCEASQLIEGIYAECKHDVDGCHACNLEALFNKYYVKVFARLSTLNSSGKATMGHHLILLNAAAMEREFKSLLAYIRFMKLTLFEKDGMYDFVSGNKQSQAKRLVNMQHHFQMKWDICIKIPIPELIHVSGRSSELEDKIVKSNK